VRRVPNRPRPQPKPVESEQKVKNVLIMSAEQSLALVQLLRMEREQDPTEFDRSELGKILTIMEQKTP